jgi:D-glycero-beta-D-manno-heptose-7-phosphate kinase
MPKEGTFQRLSDLLDAFPKKKLVVVGDLIADEFLYGQIARVSREAPVLVLEFRDLIRVPGGAGNAANNLLDLGCGVAILGFVGDDEAGEALINLLGDKGADTSRIRKGKSFRTPVKTRILAGAHHSTRQQVVRIDRGDEIGPAKPWSASDLPRATDGIILSDYGYGSINPDLAAGLQNTAARKRIPIVVDSRFRMAAFGGVTAITPNITELEAAAGISIGGDDALLRKVSQQVLLRQRLECLLVTQGRFGMTLFQRRRLPRHIPIFGTDDVADVTGAGDTVIAVFTLALACGGDPEDAAMLANYAGGIVVMKRGTATVTRSELKEAIARDLLAPGGQR